MPKAILWVSVSDTLTDKLSKSVWQDENSSTWSPACITKECPVPLWIMPKALVAGRKLVQRDNHLCRRNCCQPWHPPWQENLFIPSWPHWAPTSLKTIIFSSLLTSAKLKEPAKGGASLESSHDRILECSRFPPRPCKKKKSLTCSLGFLFDFQLPKHQNAIQNPEFLSTWHQNCKTTYHGSTCSSVRQCFQIQLNRLFFL